MPKVLAPRVKVLVILALILGSISPHSALATVINGSLEGPIVNNGVPTGWTILSGSPDTNDQTHNVGGSTPFVVAPSGPSPDGGTWVGIGINTRVSFIESFGQTITGLNIGSVYNISWYAGNFGAVTGPTYNQPNAIEVLIDSTAIGLGDPLSLGPNWTFQSLQFTAGATSVDLAFSLAGGGPSYLSIDGISINSVPEPASLPLFASGLLAMGVLCWRRKRKKAAAIAA